MVQTSDPQCGKIAGDICPECLLTMLDWDPSLSVDKDVSLCGVYTLHSLAVKTGLSMWFWCLVSNMLILWQNEVAQPPTYISWLSGSRFSCTLLEMSFVIFSERYLVVPQRRGFLDQKRKIHYYSKWNKNKQDKLAD